MNETDTVALDLVLERAKSLEINVRNTLVQKQIENSGKFLRDVLNEIKYLSSKKSGTIQIKNTGTLTYLETVFELSQLLPDVTALYKKFSYSTRSLTTSNKSKKNSVRADIVFCQGYKWMKVKVSKKGVKDFMDEYSYSDDSSDGENTLLTLPRSFRLVQSLQEASEQNLVNYQQPKLIFYYKYRRNVSLEHLEKLCYYGCELLFEDELSIKIPLINAETYLWPGENFILNMDVSALIACTSYLAHCSEIKLSEQSKAVDAIVEQAADEEENPIIELFKNIFGRASRIIACESSVNSFKHILEKMGGSKEQNRCRSLLEAGFGTLFPDLPEFEDKFLEIVPDEPSGRFKELQKIVENQYINEKQDHSSVASVPKLSSQQIIIFGTGDRYKATTLTSNKWVAKALKHLDDSEQFIQNFSDISVINHQSRSLCEKRQMNRLTRR